MTFSSYRISFLAPYFVEMQRKSFLNLLNNGLIYELSKRNPISDPYKKFQFIFYPQYYQLSSPEYTPKQAIFKAKTYASKLYVPLQLTNYKTKQLKLQWVLIGNLPLMTKRGHFIVNGSPRVIINQMVRSPGIYYQQAIDQKKRKTYYADLISHRGAWLRIETDIKKRIWIRMKKSPKIPLLVFLQAAGITEHMISQSIKYSGFLENSVYETDYEHPSGTKAALLSLYSIAYPRKKQTEITLDRAKKFLFRKFFNHRTYDLSQLGRAQLNKKFQLSVSSDTYVLTPQDLLFATDYLIKLEYGIGLLDDIDHLKNRRVRASGELIQNQLGTGFIRLEKFIREKIKNPHLPILNIITTKPVNGALREFFGSSPLSQFMDQTNPLAELTHKRRVSSLGPGGISRETAGMAVRGIHATHYGRVCPIETPEGPNAGLVNSLTAFARINYQGFIETPFYSVYQGQIQKYRGVSFLSAAQEESIITAPGDLKTDYFYNLPSNTIPVRVNSEFKKLSKHVVEYMSASPIQMISIATSLIPFLEHDDANRALMGSNMQRQAVPLILPEKPIVGTGLEARVVSDSGHGIQAKNSGFVSYVSSENIKIENFYSVQNSKVHSFTKNKFNSFIPKPSKSEPFSSLNSFTLKSEGVSQKKKNYLVFINMKVHKKFLAKNFLYLSELLFRKKSYLFQEKLSNKAWLGFNQICSVQPNFSFAFYFERQKRFAFSTRRQNPTNQNKTQSNLISQISKTPFQVELEQIFNIKRKFSTPLALPIKPASAYFIGKGGGFSTNFKEKTLSGYFATQFFSLCLAKQGKQASSSKNSTELVYCKVASSLIRENYTSKIHFLTLSENILKQSSNREFTVQADTKRLPKSISKNIFNENLAFSKNLVIQCTNLIFAQTYFKKKNLKHIFFYTSTAWTTTFTKNFSRIKPNKKSCKLLHKSPYILTNLKTLNSNSKLQKFDNTLLNQTNSKFLISKKRKSKMPLAEFTFSKSCFALPFTNSFANFSTIQKNKQINAFIAQCSHQQRKTLKKIDLTQLLRSQVSLNLEQSLNKKIKKSFNFSKFNAKKRPFSNTLLVSNTNDIHRITNKFDLYQTAPLFSSEAPPLALPIKSAEADFIGKGRVSTLCLPKKQLELKKISTKPINFSHLKNKIKNFNFSPQFYFLHEKLNYFIQPYQRSNQNTCMHQKPLVYEGEWVQKGDLVADGAASVGGELSLGKTILVAYMPWEGYNFEDAILINQRLIYDDLYTSVHIERYEIQISDTQYGLEQITSKIPDISYSKKLNLDNHGIIKVGSWVNQGDILVGKITPIKTKQLSGHEKLLSDILGKTKTSTTRDSSLRVPKNVFGRVVHVELLETENIPLEISFHGPARVHVYIAEKRKIQVGDKMSGRHGNKGIVSKIVPREDMPYLPDGTPIDMVLNPLGVPSRMNVGQIFECLLGLAGKELNEEFKISCFDEMNGPEASRSITYSKLFEARLKTGKKWLFNPNSPGKIPLFDGRTGENFHQKVTVGQPYMLKLVHLVDEKIHARSTGPYSLVTQQPLRGRSKHGGQRLGEMEVWALEGFGAAYTLQELLTTKSDDIKGRHQVMQAILENKSITLGTPESFKVLLSELQSLCLNIGVYSITNSGIRKKIDIMQLS